jgi:hypothetical protein
MDLFPALSFCIIVPNKNLRELSTFHTLFSRSKYPSIRRTLAASEECKSVNITCLVTNFLI